MGKMLEMDTVSLNTKIEMRCFRGLFCIFSHKCMGQICYFLWTSHNKKLSASGSFAPPLTPTKGSAPGPRPQTPVIGLHYRSLHMLQPLAKWNPAYATALPLRFSDRKSPSEDRLPFPFEFRSNNAVIENHSATRPRKSLMISLSDSTQYLRVTSSQHSSHSPLPQVRWNKFLWNAEHIYEWVGLFPTKYNNLSVRD